MPCGIDVETVIRPDVGFHVGYWAIEKMLLYMYVFPEKVTPIPPGIKF